MSTRWLKKILSRPVSAPRRFPGSGFRSLDGVHRLEEENWEWYSPQTFYPAKIGEVLESRYQIIGKLGYGAHSTAWLCRDLRGHKYVTLKICEKDSQSSEREVAAYGHLDSLTTKNPGALFVRELHDTFKIQGISGHHRCLVHEPLGFSIETLRQLMPSKQLPEDLVKAVLRHLLQALDCLHHDAKMVHTDLQARNVHLRIEDESVLEDFEKAEMTSPSARKQNGEHFIYESRGLKMTKKQGRPVLCDFGEARFGQESYSDDIQPYAYRAPEVILDIPWSYSADIWNFGVMTWDLLESKQLFRTRDESGEQCSESHLASMISILGPPPLDLLRRTATSQEFFHNDGGWKCPSSIPNESLESSETRLQGRDKLFFLDFIRKILQWIPERRPSAGQLLEEPWLQQ